MGLIHNKIERTRRKIARRFLKGAGVEIGALHSPLWIPPGATVRYVDRLDVAGLRAHYPELASVELAPVDLVDDGETLETIPADSLDFVIANHMLEHCENPLGAIRSHLSRVKEGGILYYALPDKRFTFDAPRPLTPFDHLLADVEDGGAASRREHYREWSTMVNKKSDPTEIDAEVERLMAMSYSIHFHVWDASAIETLFERTNVWLDGAFTVAHIGPNHGEVVAVLRKGKGGEPSRAGWLSRLLGR